MTESDKVQTAKIATTTTSTQDLLLGLVLSDRYQVCSVVGSGGMGVVYKGQHTLLNRPVAIKICRVDGADSESVLQRFSREAQTASKVLHKNVVTVHDCGIDSQGRPFLVMEFVEGESLDAVLKRDGKLSLERFTEIFRGVAQGLAEAHKKGLVHRDIKPSNIMLAREGEEEVAKLADFGLAKWAHSADSQSVTKTGEIYGTPLYMSPEQALGHPTDAKSDIYSLGCVMFHALTGVTPFMGETPIETACQHINTSAPSILHHLGDSPNVRCLDVVLRRCMAKDPAQRYESLEDLLIDLQSATSKQPKVRADRGNTQSKLTGVLWGGIALSLLGAATLIWVWLNGIAHQPAPQPTISPAQVAAQIAKDQQTFDDLYAQGWHQYAFPQQQWNAAIAIFEKAFAFSETHRCDNAKVRKMMNIWGECNDYAQHDAEALRVFSKERDYIVRDIGADNVEYAQVMRRLAHIAMKLNNIELATKYEAEALPLGEKYFSRDSDELCELYNDCVRLSHSRHDFKSAIEFGLKAHSAQFEGQRPYADSAEQLAKIYEEQHNLAEAARWYNEAGLCWFKRNNKSESGKCLRNALVIYTQLNRKSEAAVVSKQIASFRL